jgi:hypothetical protein
MIDRVRRFVGLFASRYQDYAELFAAKSLEETLAWAKRNRLLGFNQSVVRLRILYALVNAFQATHFIETGTYHGATSICAHRGLGMQVWTCEISRWNSWVTKALVCGLRDIEAVRADSRLFLQHVVSRLRKTRNVQPFFYLDAHADINKQNCPILEEISLVSTVDSFLAVIDDFEVPGRPFRFGRYGSIGLNVDLIHGPLLRSGIGRVFFPAYAPQLEQGIAQAGYAVFFRSSVLENYMRKDFFPLNLLQCCELADGRLSESCASS